MKHILFNQLPLKFGITLITILTVLSGFTGINKLSKSLSASGNTVPEVKNLDLDTRNNSEDSLSKETHDAESESISPTPILRVINKTIKSISPVNSVSPALTPLPTQQPQTGCVITLFGKQYDVSALRTTHPGGNVFVCGTDMTASYQAQHGTDMSRMQRYLIGTNATANSLSTQSTPHKYEDDEEEDDDYESEQEEMEHEFEEASREYEKER